MSKLTKMRVFNMDYHARITIDRLEWPRVVSNVTMKKLLLVYSK